MSSSCGVRFTIFAEWSANWMVRSIIAASFARAEGLKRDPQFQGVEAAAGEQGSRDQIGDAFVFVEFRVEVVSIELDGIEVARVAQQESAARDGLPEKLVKVESKGIGGFDAQEFSAMLSGEKQSTAVSCVDVKPRARGLGDSKLAPEVDQSIRNRWCQRWRRLPWEAVRQLAKS